MYNTRKGKCGLGTRNPIEASDEDLHNIYTLEEV
jgi:hypothetical protein